MVRLLMEEFSSQAARIIYMQKSDFVDAMVKAGVIDGTQAENELVRLLKSSLDQYGLKIPEMVQLKS